MIFLPAEWLLLWAGCLGDIPFEQGDQSRHIDEAIILNREALGLCSVSHPQRLAFLTQLSFHLATRHNRLGRIEDLDEAIVLDRDALALCLPGHPDRSLSLSNLAVHLYSRYDQLGRVEDLREAILLDREALVLRPPGNPDRSSSLNNLAGRLRALFDQLGGAENLNEAILLDREALALCPPGHPDRSGSLNNLAAGLCTRYNQLGEIEDLNEAILLARDALALCPPGHLGRSLSLNNLAVLLCTRYNRLGRVENLDEAILLDRDALKLHPPGHPNRSMSLNNLALDLSARCSQPGRAEDLKEAISLSRDALALRPPGRPDRVSSLNNLALHLYCRYSLGGENDDLSDAIIFLREAVKLCPLGHPARSKVLEFLAQCLSARYSKLRDAKDVDELFSLYTELARVTETVSSCDLSATRAWVNVAEYCRHPTTLLAYQTALRLLVQHLATLPSLPQHLTVLKSHTSSLAADAFSAYLRHKSPRKAVELLEQGRGVFWSQLTRLCSPLDEVVAQGPAGRMLANQFAQLTSLIRAAFDSSGPDQHDRLCRLNVELQGVVLRVRELPGLSRFLLPALFSDLRLAASDGPVIIVNASKYSCDALVVVADRDPIHIPLSITKEDIRGLSSALHALTVLAKRSNITRDLAIVLRELWDNVVSPIADFLLTIYPPQSRIWWCPTAEFSLLPLHAAGPYRKGQPNFMSLYISSYTPTLSALVRARQPGFSTLRSEGKQFIAVGQANAIGTSKLVSVGTELANIGQCVDGLATFTCIKGQESTIRRITEELGKNEWVHLACHGLPNRKRPFESAFALHDGHFTVQHIIGCELKNPEFAYLSACHTTVGDEESPDEVIHLASAMHFSGFRSVIGTMWAVDDAETNKITSVFYKHMVNESGHLDHTRAAFALWKTMQSVDVPLDQRILYVHIGV